MRKSLKMYLGALVLAVLPYLIGCSPVLLAPPAPTIVVPARPHPGAVWVAGHYRWNHLQHRNVWIGGYWHFKRGYRVIIVR